jgi:hypothetical protein
MNELKKDSNSTLYAEYLSFFKAQNGVLQEPVTPDVVDEIVLRRLMNEVVRPLNLISSPEAKALSQATQKAFFLISRAVLQSRHGVSKEIIADAKVLNPVSNCN